MLKRILLLNLVCIALTTSGALAQTTKGTSKISTAVKAAIVPSALTILTGIRYAHYESDSFAFGGAGYTGQLTSDAGGGISYGGLVAAIGGWVSESIQLEFSLLAGGAGAFSGTSADGGIVLEPAITAGYKVGETVQTSLELGYLWIPSATDFSGISIGLRFDFLVAQKKSLDY